MNNILLAITTYNQSNYTKICFDSLKRVNDIKFDVIVIDDCSTDDTIKACNKYKYDVITKAEGQGLTHSWNSAYKKFKDEGYKYLIIANNDIIVPNNSISELVSIFEKWNFSLIVPLSTKNGAGHNEQFQSVEKFYDNIDDTCNNSDSYQKTQDIIMSVKERMTKSNNLYLLDPVRIKMFNGFFFMMNRNIIHYEHKEDILFNPNFAMTKNEDEFNWSKLIPNNDFPAVCKTSFIFHFKGVSAKGLLRDNSKWKEERVKNEKN